MPAGAAIYGFTDFTDFAGVTGAQLIREGIADVQVYRAVHRLDLGADGSEVLAEAATVRAETGVAHLPGTFGVVPPAATLTPSAAAPAGAVAGLQAGVTIGVPGAVAGEEWVVSSVDDTALLPRYEAQIDLSAGALVSGDTGLDFFLAGARAVQVKCSATTAVADFFSVGVTRLASMLAGLRVPGAASVTPSSVGVRVCSSEVLRSR